MLNLDKPVQFLILETVCRAEPQPEKQEAPILGPAGYTSWKGRKCFIQH